jgi:hypothetical protein
VRLHNSGTHHIVPLTIAEIHRVRNDEREKMKKKREKEIQKEEVEEKEIRAGKVTAPVRYAERT